jgi:energy-coupling factor transporter ATP-binding protein EcfA2
MQSLSLVLKNRGQEGDALPCPLSRLEDIKVRFRRGQLSLIAAAPGGGKSSLATFLAVNMAYSEDEGVPILYISADCDMNTVGSSVLAGIMDIPLEEAELLIGREDREAFEAFDAVTDHIWWGFKASPTLEDIETEVLAFAHVQGDWPHLIIVDNLMDINEPGEEYQRYNNIIPWLVELGRKTSAHVMLLHHVTGEYQDGDRPIPRSAIKHKVSEKPRLVLTLFKPEEGLLGIRCVKHTNGPSHTKGLFGVDLPWNPERGWIADG